MLGRTMSRRQTPFVLPAHRGDTRTVYVCVWFDPPVGGEVPNDVWSDFARLVGAVLLVLLALVAYYF
jgi:hypothetical protein